MSLSFDLDLLLLPTCVEKSKGVRPFDVCRVLRNDELRNEMFSLSLRVPLFREYSKRLMISSTSLSADRVLKKTVH